MKLEYQLPSMEKKWQCLLDAPGGSALGSALCGLLALGGKHVEEYGDRTRPAITIHHHALSSTVIRCHPSPRPPPPYHHHHHHHHHHACHDPSSSYVLPRLTRTLEAHWGSDATHSGRRSDGQFTHANSNGSSMDVHSVWLGMTCDGGLGNSEEPSTTSSQKTIPA